MNDLFVFDIVQLLRDQCAHCCDTESIGNDWICWCLCWWFLVNIHFNRLIEIRFEFCSWTFDGRGIFYFYIIDEKIVAIIKFSRFHDRCQCWQNRLTIVHHGEWSCWWGTSVEKLKQIAKLVVDSISVGEILVYLLFLLPRDIVWSNSVARDIPNFVKEKWTIDDRVNSCEDFYPKWEKIVFAIVDCSISGRAQTLLPIWSTVLDNSILDKREESIRENCSLDQYLSSSLLLLLLLLWY